MKPIAIRALVLALAVASMTPPPLRAQSSSTDPATCAPDGDLSYVCGLVNVEDFVPVDGGRWLVGSSYKAGSAGLYLIDTAAKTARPVTLSIAPQPDPIYAGCAAPDLTALVTHGLDVIPGRGGVSTVLVVNHGGRESVEVFRLHPSSDSAEWIGCVILPEGASGNAVAALPQRAFVVTKFTDTRDKQSFQHLLAGRITGVVYLWRPGKGFSEVPGTRLPGDNGVVASHDGKWIVVNAYGSDEIYRVPLSGKGHPMRAKVEFHPDNLRWAPDGALFVTGQFLSEGPFTLPHDWATVRLDPRTMAVTPVLKEQGHKEFGDATSTVQVGRTLWFGTFRGDRVAYREKP